MKKLFAIVLALVLTCAVAFAAEGPITVISREDGSGTRSAFIELTGVEQDDVDMTTVDAVITNSTAVMLTSVAGDPAAIGVHDLAHPEFGDPVEIREGEVPVFWACGVTPQSIVMNSKPPFAITHAPGCMLITDTKNIDLKE